MSECIVYGLECLTSGYIYVGQTTNFSQRKKDHLKHLRNNSHSNRIMQSHYNIYGEKDFKFIILEHPAKNNLRDVEKTYILQYGNKCFNNLDKDFVDPDLPTEPVCTDRLVKNLEKEIELLQRQNTILSQIVVDYENGQEITQKFMWRQNRHLHVLLGFLYFNHPDIKELIKKYRREVIDMDDNQIEKKYLNVIYKTFF